LSFEQISCLVKIRGTIYYKINSMIKVIYNGLIYLKKGNFCEALIIEDGRIVKTGSSELLDEVPLGAEKINAEGALVLPAFHDSHLHLMWIGRRAGSIEGAGAKSIEEVISRGREHIARLRPTPGTYIQGAGVNPDLFSSGEKRDLTRDDLDKISTEYPVIISRHCGHTIYCNSMALRIADLSESAPEPKDGTIEKDENGRPTGIFREGANALVRKPIPSPSLDDMKGFLKLGMKKAHSLGLSACGSYDTGGPDFDNVLGVYTDIYEESKEAGIPALRITMQCGISANEENLDTFLTRPSALADSKSIPIKSQGEALTRAPHHQCVVPLWNDPLWGTFLSIGPLKLFADGTLGGQTAWMRQPYKDKPTTRGFPVLDEHSFNRFIQKAAAGGKQIVVHAIGDAGIDATISEFEKITSPGNNPLRHGIIHCQVTSPDLLERIARNKILSLVQPIFLADDMQILESRVGKALASTSYAWGSMQRLGIPVSYGTDAPVSSLDPLLGIEWAVLRRNTESPDSSAFYPNESVDIYSAVDAYTTASAFASFNEDVLGRIAPGFLADLVFIDRDIFSTPSEEIHKAKVMRTIIAGETVYTA
jgi:predicted amidohydrolase YtcJ